MIEAIHWLNDEGKGERHVSFGTAKLLTETDSKIYIKTCPHWKQWQSCRILKGTWIHSICIKYLSLNQLKMIIQINQWSTEK